MTFEIFFIVSFPYDSANTPTLSRLEPDMYGDDNTY